MADINTIAKSFVEFYYKTFDNNRADLKPLYRDGAMSTLTFEGAQFVGQASIVEKLTTLPFNKVAHVIATMDAQVANPQHNSILVMVTGHLQIDEEPKGMAFSQTFQLIPESGSYFVYNDVFRLNCTIQ